MRKILRTLIPIVLALAIVICLVWYLFIYDRAFTRDMLLSIARYSESQGKHNVATWFYNHAYSQSGDNDAVAIELAQQYKSSGNYTKAEFTLSKAIADGGGVDVYAALCKTYVEQDKLLDAVNMLDNIANPDMKAQLDALRPAAPVCSPEPGFYSQYITVSLESDGNTLYISKDGSYPSVNSEPYSEPIPLVDGENTIYAISVSDNGLVSPVSISGYTVGGVVALMEFADPAVEAEVRTTLNVAESTPLYTNDLWTIRSFTVPAEAKDYSDLKHMPFLECLTINDGVKGQLGALSSLANLTELSISKTPVSTDELKSIASLPLLKKLTLANCNLTSIAALDVTTGLEYLDLNNNTIRRIDALSSLQSLKELNLQHNAITDLSPLAGVTSLTKLDISYNTITTLSPITTLTGLKWLEASTNDISELGNISNLAALEHLGLSKNSLVGIGTIADCKALTELDISSNEITDISSLSSLKKLANLNFAFNQVAELPAFAKDCALVLIDGSNNKISSLKRLSGLSQLNKVYMDYNTNISSLDPLESCYKLVEVHVYATKVKDVTVLTDKSIVVSYNPVN